MRFPSSSKIHSTNLNRYQLKWLLENRETIRVCCKKLHVFPHVKTLYRWQDEAGARAVVGEEASRTHAHKFAQISSYLAYSSRGPKSRQISTKTQTETETGSETGAESKMTSSSVYIVTMAIKIKFNPTCINVALTGGGCVWVSSAPDGTMKQWQSQSTS